MSDPVIKEAIRIRDRLQELATDLRLRPGHVQANDMDGRTCDEAAKMLQKLGTEVTRLRLFIQHHQHGRLSTADLYKVVENWNSP